MKKKTIQEALNEVLQNLENMSDEELKKLIEDCKVDPETAAIYAILERAILDDHLKVFNELSVDCTWDKKSLED